MDYTTLGKNIRKYRLLRGIRQEDLAELCHCSISHIGHIENGFGKPSLEMVVIIANSLEVTVDQLLNGYYANPTDIYLREIAKRIEGYDVSQRILVCDSLEIISIRWNALQKSNAGVVYETEIQLTKK